MKRGKILQVSAVATTMDKQLRPLIDASLKENFEVHLACDDDGHMGKLKASNYIVKKIHFSRSISLKSNLKTLVSLIKLMKKEKYDIVHTHTPVASVLARVAAKIVGVPHVIYTAHGYYFHEGMSTLEYKFYYNIEKVLAKYATDYILLQSVEDFQLTVNQGFKPIGRVIHLGNGVDINKKFNPLSYSKESSLKLKKELNISPDDFVILFVGRLVREKGILDLIEAFKLVRKKVSKIKLLVVGELNLSERDQRISYYMSEQDDSIVFMGVRNDVPELLFISDVFVLPSYREGLPRSIVEAMAMKKPVIATNIRGSREQVKHNETGYLVEKGDVEALSNFILKAYESRTTLLAYGKEARNIAEKEYDESLILKKQINLFNKILS